MDKKHYVITAVTLGLICAASGALIGATNLITKDKIAQNEKNRINSGICEIYGQNATILEDIDKNEAGLTGDYKYVERLYSISQDGTNSIGYAFRTTGSNMYGKVSLLVGYLQEGCKFVGTYIVVNEQTYASTLEDNYVVKLNDGSRELDDVSCGATYGAKLVRDMIKEAGLAAEEIWKD